MDSRSEKKKDNRNENSKSCYENETSNMESPHPQKSSSNLDETTLEKNHITSSVGLPDDKITIKTKVDNVKEKAENQVKIGCGQPRPATPQADR